MINRINAFCWDFRIKMKTTKQQEFYWNSFFISTSINVIYGEKWQPSLKVLLIIRNSIYLFWNFVANFDQELKIYWQLWARLVFNWMFKQLSVCTLQWIQNNFSSLKAFNSEFKRSSASLNKRIFQFLCLQSFHYNPALN